MASIYDKALKRRDFSGVIVNKDGEGDAKGDKKDKKDKGSGADVGKVSLLAFLPSPRRRGMLTMNYFFFFFCYGRHVARTDCTNHVRRCQPDRQHDQWGVFYLRRAV